MPYCELPGAGNPCRLMTCLSEHETVLKVRPALQKGGAFQIDLLPVDGSGHIQGWARET
jgi:hypothetical protein